MPKRISALITVLAMSTTLAFGNAGAAVAQPTAIDPNAVPIVGTFPGGTFAGTLDIDRFVARNGTLVAVGTLTGTLTNTVTGVVREVSRLVRIPVADIVQGATCEVLELTLGPLDLNLLGLQVHLDQVHLLITADPSGGLLGQLLCSLAGGLGNSPAGVLARLLNQILALLG